MHQRSRIDILIVLLVIGIALIPRLQVAMSNQSAPESDEHTYDKYAWSFALNEGRTEKGKYIYHPLGSFTYRPPGYPLFMGLIYKVSGHNYQAVRVAQALLGAVSCGLLYGIGRLVFGRLVGALAALLMAGYGLLIQFTGWLLSETLFIFLLLLFIWMALVAAQDGDKRAVFLTGVGLGLATITRPVGLPMIPLLLAWLLFSRPFRRRMWTNIGLLLLALALTMGPILVKNYQIHGKPVLISTHGGITFWRGLLKGGASKDPTLKDARDRIGHSGLPELEQEKRYYQVAFDYLRRYPEDIPMILRRKFEQLMFHVSEEYTIAHKPMRVPGDPIMWRLIMGLSVLGLFLYPRWHLHQRLLLYGVILTQIAVTLVYDSTVRYRVPLVPPMALLACYAVVCLVGWVLTRNPLRHPWLTER
ncbi:MAG: ArnT family glycosyltransferase [Anaerolineae bacterium]